MNDPIAFIIGCSLIGLGLAVGLGFIGDGIKHIAKYHDSRFGDAQRDTTKETHED